MEPVQRPFADFRRALRNWALWGQRYFCPICEWGSRKFLDAVFRRGVQLLAQSVSRSSVTVCCG